MQSARLTSKLKEKKIYLWGGRQLGLSLAGSLRRLGCEPEGFLDSSPDLQGTELAGLSVAAPATVLNQSGERGFIIICSAVFAHEIAGECRRAGLVEGEDFIEATNLQQCSYYIDVSGSCNLRCLSCPRGNWPKQPPAGFMKPELLDQILDKINREDPFTGIINLYSWGEPLLHPQLPEIIRLVNRHGFQAAISSNLSLQADLSEIVRARPTYFRISASGYERNYEFTHKGGRWPVLLSNLRRLKELREDIHPGLQVEMNYHIYKDRQDDYAKMKELCAELGFIFRAGHGLVSPLDHASRLVKGLPPLNEAARQSMELQALPVDEGLKRLKAQAGLPCTFETVMEICWDGRVRTCQIWFDPGLPLLADNFLEVPLADLLNRRKSSQLCAACKNQNLHRWCGVYCDESLTEPRRKAACAEGPAE
ncbi:radical SAM protein [Deltaproteobacteria bacterium OttesenSCG-928-K17]|nr:radical SAM protein [Deltaproteobacteria bacterium OttesenSCG-928-K17]